MGTDGIGCSAGCSCGRQSGSEVQGRRAVIWRTSRGVFDNRRTHIFLENQQSIDLSIFTKVKGFEMTWDTRGTRKKYDHSMGIMQHKSRQ